MSPTRANRRSSSLFELILVSACFVLMCACASRGAPAKPVAEATHSGRATAPDVPKAVNGLPRLTRNVEPKSYELEFRIDPALSEFTGKTSIHIHAKTAVRELRLHAEEMMIHTVRVRSKAEPDREIEAAVKMGAEGGLLLELGRPLQGAATVVLSYTAELSEKPMSIYRVKEGGKWYVFSQFQPLAARAAFPAFDEPQFKTPFSTTIWVPKGQVAVSNAPLKNTREETDGQGRVWTRHHFEPTRPLPTYLVALAAGELEFSSKKTRGFPFRTITTRGKSELTTFAQTHTPAILDYQIRYLGMPYPYQKLDMVGVPNFRAGAMENAGLVTYRESILLIPSGATAHHQIRARGIIAHELAHMWFGGLVTMEWWDDIWLNEAFATWMASKTLEETWPELKADLLAVKSMLDVMEHDALRSGTPIRKRIRDAGDIRNAFDAIIYSKGAAVISMLEAWLGADTFQSGLRSYLTTHAWRNADAADLAAALDQVTDKPVAEVLHTFVSKPGVPLVSLSWSCAENGTGRVHLNQKRYSANLASEVVEPATAASGAWHIPVCMKFIYQDASEQQCVLLSESVQSFPLSRCPASIHPNAGERSYYHFAVPAGQWATLATQRRAALSASERLALPAHAWALFEAGELKIADLLVVLEQAAKTSERVSLEVLLTTLTKLAALAKDDSPLHSQLSLFARDLLAPHKTRVPLEAEPDEPLEHSLLRPALYAALGSTFRDPTIEQRARALAQRFIQQPGSVSEEHLRLLLPIATRSGDAGLHSALVSLLDTTLPPTVRESLVLALGGFEDPDLFSRSFDLLFDGRLRMQDHSTLVHGASATSATRENLRRYHQRQESKMIEYLGARSAHVLPAMARGVCDADALAELQREFTDVSRFGSGAKAVAAQTLESVERCAELRQSYQGALSEALRSRGYH